MKWINRFLILSFVLLCIQFSFIFLTGNLAVAYLSLAGFSVNRVVQPVALVLLIYSFFRKPTRGYIAFYCVHILFILLFFLEMGMFLLAMEDYQ